MKNNEIEKRISDGFREMTPAYDESLFEQPVQKAEGNEWYLSKENERRSPKLLIGMALSMAAVIFFSFQYWFVSARTFASVYMDVNPSVTLRINSKEKVREVIAENSDAEIILKDMDLKNTDIDVAVNAILGSMIRNGYLDEVHHMLLLSTQCDNTEMGDVIRERLSAQINESLTAWFGNATVLDQQISGSEDLEKIAEEYHISLGKAALIAKAVSENSSLSFEELAHMSVSDLMKKLHREGADIDEYFDDLEDYYEFVYEADHDDPDDYDDYDDMDDNDDKKDHDQDDPADIDDDQVGSDDIDDDRDDDDEWIQPSGSITQGTDDYDDSDADDIDDDYDDIDVDD